MLDFGVCDYCGRRATWEVAGEKKGEAAVFHLCDRHHDAFVPSIPEVEKGRDGAP